MKPFITIFVILSIFVSCNEEHENRLLISEANETPEAVQFSSACGYHLTAVPVDVNQTRSIQFTKYEVEVTDSFGNLIAEGTILEQKDDIGIKEYVYSDTGELMFTYIRKNDSAEDIVIYDDDLERMTFDSVYGLRKHGEKYFDCVSRISEELIEEYEEKTHKVVAYMTPPELVGAMALFGAIIGCTKYEDEII